MKTNYDLSEFDGLNRESIRVISISGSRVGKSFINQKTKQDENNRTD